MKTIVMAVILGVATFVQANDWVELDNHIRKLTAKFEAMQQQPGNYIPADQLKRAWGIILLDRTKAGVVFAYQGGTGVAMLKDPKTLKWSPPGFLGANEASLGFQIGGQQSFFVILLMNTNATHHWMEANFEFGGEARGTAGKKTAGAEGTVGTSEAPVLIYEARKGLYGGAAIKGGAIAPDEEANRTYYGQFMSMQDILVEQKVKLTESAAQLAAKIAQFSEVAKNNSEGGK